jgi:hypothetical protein
MLTDRLGLLLVIVGPVFWWSVISVSEVNRSEAHEAGYDVSNLHRRVRLESAHTFAATWNAENDTHIGKAERGVIPAERPDHEASNIDSQCDDGGVYDEEDRHCRYQA